MAVKKDQLDKLFGTIKIGKTTSLSQKNNNKIANSNKQSSQKPNTELDTNLTQPNTELDTNLTQPNTELNTNLTQPNTELNTNLTQPNTELDTNLTQPNTELDTNLTQPNTELDTNLTQPNTELNTNLTQPNTELDTNLTQPNTELDTNLTQPNTELDTNLTQPNTELDTNLTQPNTELDTNLTQPNTELDTNLTQHNTKIKLKKVDSISILSGNELKIFNYMALLICLSPKKKHTPPLTKKQISQDSQVGLGSVNTSIMRLIDKSIIVRHDAIKGGKNATASYSIYTKFLNEYKQINGLHNDNNLTQTSSI